MQSLAPQIGSSFGPIETANSKAVILKGLMHLFKFQILLFMIIPTFQMKNLLILTN